MARPLRPQSRDDFEIALICALPLERNAVEVLLDEEYETDDFSYGKAVGDLNAYTTGRLGKQDVVLAYMPGMGVASAAGVAANLHSSFKNIKVALVVGICGGVPQTVEGEEILLGDVIISTSVVQIDFGRQNPNGFVRKMEVEDILGRANPEIRALVGRAEGHLVRGRLKEKTSIFSAQISAKDGFSKSVYPGPIQDVLYPAEYPHKHQTQSSSNCSRCKDQNNDICDSALKATCEDLGCDRTLSLSAQRQRIRKAMGFTADRAPLPAEDIRQAQKPATHFGRMACSNQEIKSGQYRDRLAAEESVIGFEMESAGTWDYIPTVVIKSVCDYADSHKNKLWERYAAATAAACMKAFLEEWRRVDKPNPDRSRTLQRPSLMIPFRRDRDFVERDTLNDLWRRALEPAARVGLIGLGGVGKTQIAIEYAYRRQAADPQTWVFWVHASSAVRFEESYKQIAERLQLAGWNEPKADVLGMVYAWLSDDSNGQWTMVVDNADTHDVIFEPQSETFATQTTPSTALLSTGRSLSNYLPTSVNGSMVITSRNKEVVEGLIEYHEDIIHLEPMNEKEAILLLTKKLESPERGISKDYLALLVQQLDCMPLAIAQAAAYINQHAPRVGVIKYLEELERSDSNRAKLLEKDIRDPRRDRQASNSIITTWHVSFESIRQSQISAARLLSLMSFFNREAISDQLLRGYYLENEGQSRDEGDHGYCEHDFEDDVAMLRAYSLISIGVSDNMLNMHRLVQFSTQKWLEAHGELPQWQGRYVHILDEAFPTGDHANWTICQALFPHVETMVAYTVTNNDDLSKWTDVVYRGSWYASASGQYGVAEKMAQTCLKVREKELGPIHRKTLDSADILAGVLQYQGKYEQAEEMTRRALTGREKVLGLEHPDTLTSVYCLAHLLDAKKNYQEAIVLYQRAVNGYQKILVKDHPTTVACKGHLSSLLRKIRQ